MKEADTSCSLYPELFNFHAQLDIRVEKFSNLIKKILLILKDDPTQKVARPGAIGSGFFFQFAMQTHLK